MNFSVIYSDLLSRKVMRLRRILSPAPSGHPLSKEGLAGILSSAPSGHLPSKEGFHLQLPARIVHDPSVRRKRLPAPLSGEPRRRKPSAPFPLSPFPFTIFDDLGILNQVQDDSEKRATSVLKLWLCEPLYLPALRATFLQRKAFTGVPRTIL